MQTPENLRRKPEEEKTREQREREREREISLNQRDYKEFLTLNYRFNSLEFDPLPRRKRLGFIVEG